MWRPSLKRLRIDETMGSFWGLPGPSRFLETVAEDLHEGSSVVLRFGSRTPAGFADHLEQQTKWATKWTTLDVSAEQTPLSAVHRAVAPEAPARDFRTPQQLVLDERFQNRVFWIDGLTPTNWAAWRRFLPGFAHASRNAKATAQPPAFLLPLSGSGFGISSPREPSISSREFRDVVDRDDLYVLALQSRQARRRRRVIRALLAHAVAQVAQWDHVLAEVLLEGGPEAALQPRPALARYAEERGWTADTPELWEAGTLDGPLERPVVHSALLLAQGNDRALNRRLWAAQAAVLMPLLEERRLELVNRHRHHFSKLPLETELGLIETPEDMEFGALVLYLSRYRERGRELLGPVHRLRKFRNKLAHLQPLSYTEATHATLLNPLR